MLINYFKTSWRNLTRHKLFSLINILGLAIGISACLIIYLVTSFELSFDRFHPDGDRIYRVVGEFDNSNGNKSPIACLPNPAPTAMRNEFSGLETVAAFHNYSCSVTIPDGTSHPRKFAMPKEGEVSPVIIAEQDYFTLFRYDWLAGNAMAALREPYKVVLSENEAHKYFGPGPVDQMIGKEVIYSDSLRVQVSGIVADWKGHSDLAFSDFISYPTVLNSFLRGEVDQTQWGMFDKHSQAFVKLARGVSPAQIRAQGAAFVKDHISVGGGTKFVLGLQPLSDIHFNAAYHDAFSRKADLPTLYILMGIAVFLLLLAAVNFVNLFTARSIQRSKEIGIRKVLGSNRARLVLQFLAETSLVAFFAVLISLIVAWPILSGLHSFIPDGVRNGLGQPATLLFLGSILLVTSLLAGLYPALVLSSRLPLATLKGMDREGGGHKAYMRRVLTVFQLTISLILIIAMLVVSRQIDYMNNKDLGFVKDGIVNIQIVPPGESLDERGGLLAERLRALTGVEAVSQNMGSPAMIDHNGTILKVPGAPEVHAQFEFADERYIPLFRLTLIAGRNLLPSDTIRELVINETCAKELGFRKPADAIGKLVGTGFGDKRLPVVGVVADFYGQSLHEKIPPTFITTSKDRNNFVSVKLALGNEGKSKVRMSEKIASLKSVWAAVYPDKAFDYSFFDESLAQFYQKEQKTATIVRVSAGIAILISCMGLFALAVFTAERRKKEIGIRKVLGATVGGIAAMLSREFVLLILVALLIASPFAWLAMNKWLADYAYRIPVSWWIFVLAGLGALAIGLLTVGLQAIRAAIANPVKSLRAE
jgi:putative ABC transport system permease protein